MVQINNKLIAAVHEYEPYNPITPIAATIKLENTISTIIGLLSVIGFIYFTIQIIFAGYAFVSSQGDAKKLEDARHKLTNSILGLTIIIVAVGFGALLGAIFGIENIFNLNTLLNSLHL